MPERTPLETQNQDRHGNTCGHDLHHLAGGVGAHRHGELFDTGIFKTEHGEITETMETEELAWQLLQAYE